LEMDTFTHLEAALAMSIPGNTPETFPT